MLPRNEKQVRNELVRRMLNDSVAYNKLTKKYESYIEDPLLRDEAEKAAKSLQRMREHAELVVKRMMFIDVINHPLMRDNISLARKRN